MTAEALLARVRQLAAETPPPTPGAGHTPQRHGRLFDAGRENLSVARLVEAHWDALAILAEAGCKPAPGALYGVWAAEAPDKVLRLEGGLLSGAKPFCSGAGLVDRALVTVKEPEATLIDIDLVPAQGSIAIDESAWKTAAFANTKTATVTLDSVHVASAQIIGATGFYLVRPGFWHGAIGPAACWAGGAAGLVAWAVRQTRHDPHTLAHLGAMHASLWSMKSALDRAGEEIDRAPGDVAAAHIRALTVRHIIEQGCSDILQRLTRAYGPYPLAFEESISGRVQELNLYIRQSHAERDLEVLGKQLLKTTTT